VPGDHATSAQCWKATMRPLRSAGSDHATWAVLRRWRHDAREGTDPSGCDQATTTAGSCRTMRHRATMWHCRKRAVRAAAHDMRPADKGRQTQAYGLFALVRALRC
jgi:hypothetical protein